MSADLTTWFDLLGLPRRFALDPAAVERNYLARSREVHPDYHQFGTAAEQRCSMEQSAALNEAYATLSDPFRRAEYLLILEGGPSAAEHKGMPADFLEEMLELRMEIEELREAGAADSPGRKEMEQRLKQRREELVQQIGQSFAVQQGNHSPERQEALVNVRKLLNSARYIQGLLRDLKAD